MALRELQIREARDGDADDVGRVHRAAFGRDAEAALVDALIARGEARLSLVAECAGRVSGHVMFSDLALHPEPSPTRRVLALAPLAVETPLQRRGIGSMLVREGVRQLRERGADAVVVLGDPSYYERFGFAAAATARLRSPFRGPHWMALELRPGALSGVAADVRYATAFDALAARG
jgi:putative acetyltransferase